MQVALIAAYISHSNRTHAGPDIVGGGSVCNCMLLLYPAPTGDSAGQLDLL